MIVKKWTRIEDSCFSISKLSTKLESSRQCGKGIGQTCNQCNKTEYRYKNQRFVDHSFPTRVPRQSNEREFFSTFHAEELNIHTQKNEVEPPILYYAPKLIQNGSKT